MPLFGKKHHKEKGGSGYPTQSAYPAQQPSAPSAPIAPQYAAQAPNAPPPYTAAPPQYPGYPAAGYAAPPPHYPAGFVPQQQQYQQPMYAQPPMPQQTVMVQNGFDAGARFGPGGASVPPPPPGCAPNMAQMAMAQGHNVVVSQRPSDFLTGGSDGGYVIW